MMKKQMQKSSFLLKTVAGKIFFTVIVYVFSLALLLSACSLKYEDVVEVSEKVPELVFKGTEMTRYEDKKITMQVKAETLEQYKATSETYAKNVEFSSYENEELSTDGSCGFMYLDTSKEIYELYDDIRLFNHKENINFYAEVLRWNARNEQLTSGRGDIVRIETKDTSIRGSGFSASGVGKDFSFRGNVTGNIDTDKEEKQ